MSNDNFQTVFELMDCFFFFFNYTLFVGLNPLKFLGRLRSSEFVPIEGARAKVVGTNLEKNAKGVGNQN